MVDGIKSMPKDLQVLRNILKDFGITDYEPSVMNQMLEFAYRHSTNIIEDAALYSSHAKKKSIDSEDVKLAINLLQDKHFASPPSRELTAEVARSKNVVPLPAIRSSSGLRLPPDRHSLTSCNFCLKTATKKNRTVHTVSRVNVSNISNSVAPRPTFSVQKSVPCPIIKLSEGSKVSIPASTLSPMPTSAVIQSVNSLATTQILMPTIGIVNTGVKSSIAVNKRPHEDDDYDN